MGWDADLLLNNDVSLCSSMVEQLIHIQPVTGSNPVVATIAGIAQLVERGLAKAEASGSSPDTRSSDLHGSVVTKEELPAVNRKVWFRDPAFPSV